MNPEAFIAFAGLLGFGAARWRVATICALVLVVFEGAVRKWFLPEAQQAVYLAKDVLLLGAYAGFFVDRLRAGGRIIPAHRANGVIGGLALFAVVELANPLLANPAVGLFGVRSYLIYIPLMYIIPTLFPDLASLRRFLLLMLVLALVPLALGPVQFFLPMDHVLNRYVGSDELGTSVAGFRVGNHPRITGTFSYISGYTVFLTALVAMGLPCLVRARRWWVRGALTAMLSLTVVNMLMTGSRGPALVAAAMAVLVVLTEAIGGRGFGASLGLASLALVAYFCTISAFPQAYAAFADRASGNEDVVDRVFAFSGLSRAVGAGGLVGEGIGSNHQAVKLAGLADGETQRPTAESEWERILLEVGVIGFAIVMAARALVALELWWAIAAARGTPFYPYVLGAFLYATISLPGQLVFNSTASMLFWFLAGFSLLPAMRRQAAESSPARPFETASQRVATPLGGKGGP